MPSRLVLRADALHAHLGNALRRGRLDLPLDALRMTATLRRRRGIRGEQGSLLTILVMPIHSATMSACDAPTREQRSRIMRVTWDRGGHCARLDDHIPPQHIEGQTSLPAVFHH